MDAEVESLWTQYRQEQWTKWQQFISPLPARSGTRRKRRLSPRYAGQSPLKNEYAAVDVEVEGYDDASPEGVGSDGPSESEPSASDEDSEGSPFIGGKGCVKAWPSSADECDDGRDFAWAKDVAASLPDFDDMLPNYG